MLSPPAPNPRRLALNMQTCSRCRREALGACPRGAIADCPDDGQPLTEHARSGECPRGLLSSPDVPVPPITPSVPRVVGAVWGPKLWAELHATLDADPAWDAAFAARLPCGECKAGWLQILKETPPVYGAGRFLWTFEAHNNVNAKLGKPLMTLAEARARWRPAGE